jgi:hypothetical protein
MKGDYRRMDSVMLTIHVGSWWPNVSESPGPGMYIARMALYDDRLTFEPPGGSLLTHLRPVIAILSLALLPSVGNLRHRLEFALRDIDRFHTWSPPFSGPPMLQIGSRGWSFMLLERAFPMKHASEEDVRAHFGAIEAAWLQAREPVSPSLGDEES